MNKSRATELLYGRGRSWELRDLATEIIQSVEAERDNTKNRLYLAVQHLNGKDCPSCKQSSVIIGCSGECCVLCDYDCNYDDIDIESPEQAS